MDSLVSHNKKCACNQDEFISQNGSTGIQCYTTKYNQAFILFYLTFNVTAEHYRVNRNSFVSSIAYLGGLSSAKTDGEELLIRRKA